MLRPLRHLAWLLLMIGIGFGWTGALEAPAIAKSVVARAATNPAASAPTPVTPPAPVRSATPAPTTKPVAPITYLPAGLADSTPILTQGNFLGGYGCAPTAVSMVFGYFHNTNAAYAAAAPSQLADGSMVLAGQGVPYPAMVPRMLGLGYTTLLGHEHATLNELKDNLNQGPVIVAVGINTAPASLVPGRVNHSVVVVGVANDDSMVLLNDPRLGRQIAVSMTSFQAMWAYGQNAIIVLRP